MPSIMYSVFRMCFSVVFLCAVVSSHAFAQRDSGDGEEKLKESKTRLVLGSASGTPGTSVVTPIYLAPAEGIKVGRVKLVISFVSRNLRYSRVDRGLAAEEENVQFSAEVLEGKNDQGLEVSTLTIIASSPTSDMAPKAIPAGLLGYIGFEIGPEARSASIALHAVGETTELGSGNAVQDLLTVDGQIEVIAPGSIPLVACFFFTH
jgi:hypothetical protein